MSCAQVLSAELGDGDWHVVLAVGVGWADSLCEQRCWRFGRQGGVVGGNFDDRI